MDPFDDEPTNKRVWQSFVYHNDDCYFVSTILRQFETAAGITRGYETITWKYDMKTNTRGDLLHVAFGLSTHQTVCRNLIAHNRVEDTNDN